MFNEGQLPVLNNPPAWLLVPRPCAGLRGLGARWSTNQGLTLAHFKAQREALRGRIAHVRAQLEHLRATSTGYLGYKGDKVS
jgi:hypothetical protein